MKKINFKNIFILLFSLSVIISCEEDPVVIPDFVPPVSDRVILIEEFTGADCGPCPAGAAEIEDLLVQFPNNLISVGIHAGSLARPVSGSKHDYKIEKGQNIYSELGALATPMAAISRVKFESPTREAQFNPWKPYITEVLENSPFAKAKIDLESNFDNQSRNLSITANIEPQVNLSGDIRLTLMIVQEHIEDAQNVNGTIEEDYIHRHVLLDVITEWNGDNIANNLSEGETFDYTYNYTIPEEDQGKWNTNDISLIGFVAIVGSDTKEILQADKIFLDQ